MKVLGLILAGGQATRMGGGDKALLPLGDKTLLDVLLSRFSSQVDAVLLNVNGEVARFSAFNLPVIADEFTGFQGPLAGIHAGLLYATAHGFTHILSVAGDTPFLPLDLVSRMKQAGKMVSVSSNGHTHPVIGLWPIGLKDELYLFLSKNKRKIDTFTAQHGCVYVDFSTLTHEPFFNINTKEELEIAAEIYKTILNLGE